MLSIAPGYDPRYLTRAVGRGAENYYLAATVEHGEPPGRWWGVGAEELGLEPGSEVDGPTMETLYEKFLDPRDPDFLNAAVPDEEKARLGRRKSTFTPWKETYDKTLAAEPEASEERRKELEIAAKQGARQNVIHHDATFSPSKSVTMVHAGLLAAAQQAENAGNAELAGRYREGANVVLDGVLAGAEASLRYLRDNAGEARTGYHGVKIAGRTTGRWTDAGGWVVARFLQHTNREGEPQLHVHQAILNRQLCSDGKWRGLDGMAIYRVRPAAAAHGERVMEEYLTRRLGLEFKSRPDGQGREVVGVDQEIIDAFSTRRAQVLEGTPEAAGLNQRIADYVAAHGVQPSPRLLFQMAQEATKGTKAAKPKGKNAPSPAQELAAWEEHAVEKELGLLSDIPRKVLDRLSPSRAAKAREALADADIGKVLTAALADAQEAKATFTRYEVTRFINRHLPDYLGGLPPERVEALLEQLTDAALDPAGPGEVRLLTAPDEVHVPEELRRLDGRSVYQAQACERYTTADQLDRETALTTAALAPGAPRLSAERAAELIGPSVEQAKQAALEGRAVPGADGYRPYQDQADAIFGILTSARRVDVLQGAAGTGKSFTLAALANMWRAETGTPVLGLTTSQNAAGVLKREGLDDAWNITRWLQAIDDGEASLRPGQMIVVDEASMVTTDHLARIQELADAARAKVVWTGDTAQLSAPGAGGAMRHLVEVGGSQQLTTVVRFRNEWEKEASLKLRDGLPEALVDYDQHGRLRDGDREEMEARAYRAYLSDYLSGKQSLLLAPTNEKASELSGRVRADLVALDRVSPGGVQLHDGNTAGRGDLIMARRNVVDEVTRLDELTNRDVIKVSSIDAEGRILGRIVDDKGRYGKVVTLEPDYVRQHVELGYAGTVHAAQGRTVDTCHAVVDETGNRQMLYVMLTRGRDDNYAYVIADRVRESDLRTGPEQAADRAAELLRDQAGSWDAERGPLRHEADADHGDRYTVLSGVLAQDQADQTAIEALVEEGERPRSLGHLGSQWVDQIREHTADAYINRAEARGHLSPDEAARLRSDDAKNTLGRLLRSIEMAGLNPDAMMTAAIVGRELGSADSVAQVLHWRIERQAEERGIPLDRLDVAEEQITGTWRERTPDMGRPVTDQFLGELADRMDVREHELGQDALQNPPEWLTEALGAPSGDAAERGEWAERAGRIMSYREQYGRTTETDPIGAPPSRKNPEQRASWFAAHDALGSPERSREITGASDGQLWTWRAAYEREARWAPAPVGEELGRVTAEADDRHGQAVRLRAQAEATRHADPAAAAALDARADGQEQLSAALRQRQGVLAEIHEARQAWDRQTKDLQVLAGRADAELRRRDGVDVAALPPLHLDRPEARERIEAQWQARQAERAAAREIPADQLALDLGPQAELDIAWGGQRLVEPEFIAPELTSQWRHRRLEWILAEIERSNARGDVDSATPELGAAEQQHQEREQDREPGTGQTALDLFGQEQAERRVDRDEQPELADALDKARAARQIAEIRQAEKIAELEAGDPEAERRRREAEREAPDVDQRAAERAEQERSRLEERTRRAAAARGRSAADIVRDAYPQSIQEALDYAQQHEQPYQPHQYEDPGRDQGPSLGR
jgi:hypothetical protein